MSESPDFIVGEASMTGPWFIRCKCGWEFRSGDESALMDELDRHVAGLEHKHNIGRYRGRR